ncbi:MAG: outer membrane protein assembly factor BamD [Geothrix sp.]|uniref:outer membrane protein assembly factor BamD n=1 Tax=Geothrix sp. TaxID=1962974 RepID=UPI0017C98204|nr:outer membrane protein assembly factor BamD [Geothrix sp.]NWJ41563.1 outer membrane protein assembly factor BamD [Geothrix sp.]WIL20453.1 MAG: outer membrane protein assembly factor BamD [Geothrix sp.]
MKRILTALTLVAVLAGLGLGCKKPKAVVDKGVTATELLATADKQLKQGKFNEARTTLRHLEQYLPGSAEFPKAKLMLGDSFFFQPSPSYPEAEVEYASFLNYFPRHELRDYAMYHQALCHFSSIESAERDQTETRKALTGFQQLIAESPGSPYAGETRAKILQCWRRIAEHELIVGVFYVNTYFYPGAERRLKNLLETYPDYVDRERAYFYLGEAMRQRLLVETDVVQFNKDYLAKREKADFKEFTREQVEQYNKDFVSFSEVQIKGYRAEAKSYYQKLVESYPGTEWARRAADRLITMGTSGVKEELDS